MVCLPREEGMTREWPAKARLVQQDFIISHLSFYPVKAAIAVIHMHNLHNQN